MYFQLMYGVHCDGQRDYQVTTVRNSVGEVISQTLPVIKSNSDLVKAFGAKFRRITEQQAVALEAEANSGSTSETDDADSELSPVAGAALKGATAAGIAPESKKVKVTNVKSDDATIGLD